MNQSKKKNLSNLKEKPQSSQIHTLYNKIKNKRKITKAERFTFVKFNGRKCSNLNKPPRCSKNEKTIYQIIKKRLLPKMSVQPYSLQSKHHSQLDLQLYKKVGKR